jgi:hypothetical protein
MANALLPRELGTPEASWPDAKDDRSGRWSPCRLSLTSLLPLASTRWQTGRKKGHFSPIPTDSCQLSECNSLQPWRIKGTLPRDFLRACHRFRRRWGSSWCPLGPEDAALPLELVGQRRNGGAGRRRGNGAVPRRARRTARPWPHPYGWAFRQTQGGWSQAHYFLAEEHYPEAGPGRGGEGPPDLQKAVLHLG